MKLISKCCMAFFLSLCATASAQNFKQEIDLSGSGNLNAPAKPFGIATNPVNGFVYVAIAGSFSSNNNAIAVIDPATDTIVSTISVGEFPEDIAFDPSDGSGAVTNSTSGSVSFFDVNHNVTATIQLPDPFAIGSCYPYGICFVNSHYYISTVDGSGEVYAINSSSKTLVPSLGFSTSYKSNARMQALANGQLLVSTTAYNSTWSGSTAGIFKHNLQSNSPENQVNYLSADNVGAFPSTTDFALANGNIFMTGLDFEGLIFIVKDDGTPVRAIDTSGNNGHGLAASDDGSLLVLCNLSSGAVVFIDAVNEKYHTELNQGGMPNDATFASGKLYVSDQANERVLVFEQLPSFSDNGDYTGVLEIDNSAPSIGDFVNVTLTANPGQQLWLVSASAVGNSVINGVNFDIGPTLDLQTRGNGSLTLNRRVPNAAGLSGRLCYLQGAVADNIGNIRPTRPAMLIVQ